MRTIAALIFLLCAIICATTVIAIRSFSSHPRMKESISISSSRKRPAVDRTPIRVGVVTYNLSIFENTARVYPSLEVKYIEWGKPFPSAEIRADRGLGVTTVVVLEPSHVSLTGIAAGRYDSYISSWARADRKLGLPVILSFAPEANGSWYRWGAKHISPALYRRIWRHLHERLDNGGARKLTWLWQVNSVWPGSEALSLLWPGDKYVDEIGIDGQLRTARDSYVSVFDKTVTEVRSITRDPILISEVAVSRNAKRPAQITGLFEGAREDHLSGIIFFDVNPQWQIDADPSALTAFRASVRPEQQTR